MKRISIIILTLMITSVIASVMAGELMQEIPASAPPSEQTYMNIENNSTPPNLRAAPPGETGNPQGHVPAGNTSCLAIAALAIAFLSYKQYKTKLAKQ